MAVGVGRIPLAMAMPFVKGQKEGRLASQLGGHINLVGIHRHMHQATTKVQQGLSDIAILPVLLLAVIAGILAGPVVFKLKGYQRDAVDKQHHVDLLLGVLRRVGYLPGTAKEVGSKILAYRRAAASQRRRIHQGQVSIINAQTLFQQMQYPPAF